MITAVAEFVLKFLKYMYIDSLQSTPKLHLCMRTLKICFIVIGQ